MTKRTTKHFILSLSFLGLTTVFFLLALFVTQSRGQDLQKENEMIRNQQTIQKKQQATESIADLSAEERLRLKEYFLSEREIINFISSVERQALQMNINVETTQLAVEPIENNTTSILKIGFNFTGTEPAVIRFMQYIELLPYYKEIPNAVISASNTAGWEGSVIIHIIITP